jgi:alpha-tubulin suppressor-like RCC1 family protein
MRIWGSNSQGENSQGQKPEDVSYELTPQILELRSSGEKHTGAFSSVEVPAGNLGEKKVAFMGCTHGITCTLTETKKLYLWGELRDDDGSVIYHSPKIVENVTLRIPLTHYQKRLWENLLIWVFAGRKDRNSAFRRIPVEVIFVVVGFML